MAVTADDIRDIRRQLDEYEGDAGDLRELHSHAEVIAFMAAAARDQGRDEADLAEIYTRVLRLDKPTLRETQQLLGRLGYSAISHRLRRVARQARPKLTWLQRIEARRAKRGY